MSVQQPYRIRVLFEDYSSKETEAVATAYANRVQQVLTDHFPFGKVIVYVEANPPKDEVEEW